MTKIQAKSRKKGQFSNTGETDPRREKKLHKTFLQSVQANLFTVFSYH